MMQETGNSVHKNRSLSILIRTDGLSFFIADANEVIRCVDVLGSDMAIIENVVNDLVEEFGHLKKVSVIVSSDRNVVVPSEIYEQESINNYFMMKGVDIDFENDYIITSSSCGSVYVWLFSRDITDFLNSYFDEVVYTHILEVLQLHGVTLCDRFKGDVCFFSCEGNLLAASIFERGKMVFQEMFEVNSSSDTVFYVKAVLLRFSLASKGGLVIVGHKTDRLADLCSKFSKRVTVVGYL